MGRYWTTTAMLDLVRPGILIPRCQQGSGDGRRPCAELLRSMCVCLPAGLAYAGGTSSASTPLGRRRRTTKLFIVTTARRRSGGSNRLGDPPGSMQRSVARARNDIRPISARSSCDFQRLTTLAAVPVSLIGRAFAFTRGLFGSVQPGSFPIPVSPFVFRPVTKDGRSAIDRPDSP